MLHYIVWDVSPEIFTVGPITVRWYGLLFATGFLLGQQVLIRMFRGEGKPERDVETLTVYMVLSTVIGARLGHCLFYEPETYLADPIRILKIWEGGLASHGAGIAIVLALFFYARSKKDQPYLWVTDRMVVTVALAGCCIRLGNLMNSEIIGKPADAPWAFVFARSADEAILTTGEEVLSNVDASKGNRDTTVAGIPYTEVKFRATFKPGIEQSVADKYVRNDFVVSLNPPFPSEVKDHMQYVPSEYHPAVQKDGRNWVGTFEAYGIPRHPSQLYEAFSCIILFFLLYAYWNKYKERTPMGSITGMFFIYIFGLRFLWEYLKEPQVDFENEMISNIGLNMGQLLSIPAVLFGIIVLALSFRSGKPANVKA